MGLQGNLTAGEILEQLVHANRVLAEIAAQEEGLAPPAAGPEETVHLWKTTECRVSLSRKERRIRNIVFMGMGEPLNNYDCVLQAIRCMADPGRFGLSMNHISLSTVGVIPYMRRLSREAPSVNLALSLHAPTQELRARIVPSAAAYPLDQLVDAVEGHLAASPGKARQPTVMIEYVLLAGVNDSQDNAHELGQLLRGRQCMVNLIPWNPTFNPELVVQ